MSARASSRSTPAGSSPWPPAPPSRAGPGAGRSARTTTTPSSNRGGVRPKSGRGLSKTVTGPAASSAASRSARHGRATPSDSQTSRPARAPRPRPAPPRGPAPTAAARAPEGAQPRRRQQGTRGRRRAGRSAARLPPAAPGAPPRPAAPRPARSGAASRAHPPSWRRARPAAARCPARSRSGLSTGPAKPRITAATASILSSSSHHGVRSVWVSSSVSPSSSATPGNRRRIGAGGTARRISHRIGSATSASRSSGAVKPTGPSVHISEPARARREATAAPRRAACRCGGS